MFPTGDSFPMEDFDFIFFKSSRGESFDLESEFKFELGIKAFTETEQLRLRIKGSKYKMVDLLNIMDMILLVCLRLPNLKCIILYLFFDTICT